LGLPHRLLLRVLLRLPRLLLRVLLRLPRLLLRVLLLGVLLGKSVLLGVGIRVLFASASTPQWKQ
jgi:hypothetical protein